MNKRNGVLVASIIILTGCATMMTQPKLEYPFARMGEVAEDYHGTTVFDPYRWMEDPDNPETLAWVEKQNDITENYIHAIPVRETIEKRLTERWDYPKYGIPAKHGQRYYFFKNDGLQNQYVMYALSSLESEPEVFIDPNQWSKDGTIALAGTTFSKDGSLVAYAVSNSGSDWKELRIKNALTGEDHTDTIQWYKFGGVAWKHDNSGFFYSRYPEPQGDVYEAQNKFNKLYWHKLGTPQSDDIVVYEDPAQPEYTFSPYITDDGKYLVITVHYNDYAANKIYVRDMESDGPFIKLFDKGDAEYHIISNNGSTFLVTTTLDAPRTRIVAVDLHHPEIENWKTIIPQSTRVIDAVLMVQDKFVIEYMQDAHHVLQIYNQDGSLHKEIELPTLGSISGLSGKREDTEMFFGFTSFLYPGTQYRYDFATDSLTVFRESEFEFDADAYETRQVFYPTNDPLVKIPMFITHKKGLRLDGKNPTLLYGYGGFNISLKPNFSLARTLWLENGGVYAMANLRGGGEYGDAWHKAGMFQNKINVFGDFYAASEWLISNGYTSPQKLAIQGGSNGGLLVAATMLQRPDLFGAVICQVPVTDMLRFHKFTVGKFWTGEYGNAEENPDHFKFLYAYSPLHNVKEGVDYPPILVTCADTDDRVVPSHSKKFMATLQQKSSKKHPHLIRIETKAGHGAGKPTTKVIEEASDIYAFLFKQLDMKLK